MLNVNEIKHSLDLYDRKIAGVSTWLYDVIYHVDLSLAMQKLYQTFVALAAQLQGVHENVKVSSENVLNGPYLIFLYENV